ncbi:benzoate transporter [Rahnella bonaserana]|uniref:benzoate transporter n=1 Tax=Rahnella bonaserana TaxID=2816248 RepID=UPI003207B2C6
MIYDCFLYYDEDMLLDIRLHTLDSVVDKFVIVESLYTFTGKKREKLNFDIEKFIKFKDKIIYVVNYTQPKFYDHEFLSNSSTVKAGESDPWENETIARNSIMRGLNDANDADIIIVSDVDEILRPDAIKLFRHRNLCTTVHMDYFNYKFNVQVMNPDGTPRKAVLPKMVTFKTLKNFFFGQPDLLRNVKRRGNPIRDSWLRWNWLKYRTKTICDGGWHFSWVMTDRRISEKMSTISHTEHNVPEFNNPKHIRDCVENNLDIWGRPRLMKVLPVTKRLLPAYLVERRSHMADFFRD